MGYFLVGLLVGLLVGSLCTLAIIFLLMFGYIYQKSTKTKIERGRNGN